MITINPQRAAANTLSFFRFRGMADMAGLAACSTLWQMPRSGRIRIARGESWRQIIQQVNSNR